MSGFTYNTYDYTAGATNAGSSLGGGAAAAAAGTSVYSVPVLDGAGDVALVVAATNVLQPTGQSQCRLNSWAPGAATAVADAVYGNLPEFTSLN